MASLFEPGRIGPIEMPNRVVMASMTTRAADADGFVTPQTIAYYVARARGGVGLDHGRDGVARARGRHRRRELGIYDDRFLPGLTRLVAAIHAAARKASIQLGHGGGHTRADICGETPVAPSAIPHPVQEVTIETIVPQAMTRERIDETTAAFARPRRARAGGRLRLRRDPRRARLPDLAVPHPVREPARRRVRRQPGEPRALRPRRAARASRPRCRHPGDLPRYRSTIIFPDGMPLRRGLQVAIWAAEAGADALHVAAGHYRSLPSARAHDPADGLSRCAVPRLRARA